MEKERRMNNQDRKLLNSLEEKFTRIDERTLNIWRVVEIIERHDVKQNGLLQDAIDIAKGNRIWITVFKWGGGFIVTALIAFGLRIAGVY